MIDSTAADAAGGDGPLPAELRACADLLGGLAAGLSPHQVVRGLLGEDGLLWRCCSAAVREHPAWMDSEAPGRALALIAERATGTPDERRASLMASTAPVRVARALCAPAGASADLVAACFDGWDALGAVPPRPVGAGLLGTAGASKLAPGPRRRLEGFLRAVQGRGDDPGTALVVLTALLLAGAPVRARPVARISVVFGRPDTTGSGAAGVLELREVAGGPAGFFPDPRAMGGIRTDDAFTLALATAWESSPGAAGGRCVLWRLVVDARPVPSVESASLGAPCALALRALLRRPASRMPSRAWPAYLVHRFVSRPRPRTAVTGAIDAQGSLHQVDDLDAKFAAARSKGWRLIAPEQNEPGWDAAHDSRSIVFAANLAEAARHSRRFRAAPVLSVLGAVTAVTTAALVVNAVNAHAARERETVEQLVKQSQRYADTDTGLAQLLAVRAYRSRPSPQTKAALFRAVFSSPYLVQLHRAEGRVSALATSGDGRSVFAGTRTGTLRRWKPTGGSVTTVTAPAAPGPVTQMSADDAGDAVALIAGGRARLWSTGPGTIDVRLPDLTAPSAIAISPSGRYVAAASHSTITGNSSAFLTVVDRWLGTTRSTRQPGLRGPATDLAMPDDSQLVMFENGYGQWARLTLPGRKVTARGTAQFGTTNYGVALSRGGGHFTYSNNGDALPVWNTRGPTVYEKPERSLPTQGSEPTALALSADGTQVAQTVNNTTYVSPSLPGGAPEPRPLALRGLPTVGDGTLTFLGRARDRLVSASGEFVALWDLGRFGRTATVTAAAIPVSCNACSPPFVAVQPEGENTAIVDGNGESATVHRLTPPSPPSQIPAPAGLFTAPTWTTDGRSLLLLRQQDDGAQIHSTGHGFPLSGQWPPPGTAGPPDPAAAARVVDGGRLVEVHTSGTVEARDLTTGRSLRRIPGPREMTVTAGGVNLPWTGSAAVQRRGTHAAIINTADADRPSVFVADLAAGTARSIPGESPTGVAYLGDRLLVQRLTGAVEVWDAGGSRRDRTINGVSRSFGGPVTDDRDTVVQPGTDGTATVLDFRSGEVAGTLPLPAKDSVAKTGMAFSPDGRTLVSVTAGEQKLISWDFDPDHWVTIACSTSGRDLSPDEWTGLVKTPVPDDLRCEG